MKRKINIIAVVTAITIYLIIGITFICMAQVSKKTIRQAQDKALQSKTKYQLGLIPHMVNGVVVASVDSATLADYELQAYNDSMMVEGLKVARGNLKK